MLCQPAVRVRVRVRVACSVLGEACNTRRAGGADDEDRLRGVPLEQLDQRLSLAWREDARLQAAVKAQLCGELLRLCGMLCAVVGGHHDAAHGKRRCADVLVREPLPLGLALAWLALAWRLHRVARRHLDAPAREVNSKPYSRKLA